MSQGGPGIASTIAVSRSAAAPRIRGVLLDVDGTLLDSNDAHATSWVDVLRAEGYQATFEQVRALIGKGGDKLLPEVTGVEKESAEGTRLTALRKARFTRHHLPHLRPFAGARALLERMRRDGLTLTVATSAAREEMRALLEQAGIADLIEDATSSSDADRSKPDPDIIEAALEQSGLSASDALMLGDTPYDVEASLRAGVGVVALRCGGWDDRALRGALAIYDHPAQLLAEYDRSPFAIRSGSARAAVEGR